MTTSILPVNKVLTDSGCIWESQLAAQGWNELPDEKKVGRVVKSYTDGSCDVHFDFADLMRHRRKLDLDCGIPKVKNGIWRAQQFQTENI